MRAVVQRVSEASVVSEGKLTGKIGRGYAVLLGISSSDTEAEALLLAEKLFKLRICEDENGAMNLSAADAARAAGQSAPEMLVVSQFTLYADTRRGNRPSFIEAAPPELAEPLYERFVGKLSELGVRVGTGVFRTHMDVALVNDGPVTIILDTDDLKRPRNK